MKICPTCKELFDDSESLCPTDGTALEPAVTEAEELLGQLLSGKYKLKSILGKGGMGAVFDGEHIQLGRPVAVKMIHPMFLCPESASRFQREAKVASSLNHPNIIQIYDFGQSEDGSLYLVMEKLQGRELKDDIVENGPMEPNRAIRLFRQICEGMAVAHAQKMIHRDLKPQNVMLVKDARGNEQVKILDFGLARTMDTNRTALTEPGAVMGSPQYMSPEQISGQEVTHESDIYSLGLILYEMIAGKAAFTGKNASETFKAHLTEMPTPLLLDNAPSDLNEVVMRCLAKDPKERFASVEDLMATLPPEPTTSSFAAAHAAPPPMPRAAAPASAQTSPPSQKQSPQELAHTAAGLTDTGKELADTGKDIPATKASKGSGTWILVGAVGVLCFLLALGALGAFVLLKSRHSKTVVKTSDIGHVYDVKPAGAGTTQALFPNESATENDSLQDNQVQPVSDPAAPATADSHIETVQDAGVAKDGVDENAAQTAQNSSSAASEVQDNVPVETQEPSSPNPPVDPAAASPPPVQPVVQPEVQTQQAALAAAEPTPVPSKPQPVQPTPIVVPERPKVYVEVQGDPMVTQHLKKEVGNQLKNAGCPLALSRDGAHMVVRVQANAAAQKNTNAFGARLNLRTYTVLISAEAVPWKEAWPDQVMDQITFDPTYAATKVPYEAQRVTKGLGRKLMSFWDEKR